MADAQPLVLYDISSPLRPCRSYAPNPTKSRLALSMKGVPFTTQWIDIMDIPDVRKGLHCPAVRKLADGSDYYTLPMLVDPGAGGKVIGDSFDIACYLDDTWPDAGGRLFPDDSTRTGLDYESPHKDLPFVVPLTQTRAAGPRGAYADFNVQVDATFTTYTILAAAAMPFNPETAEAVRALFLKRAHMTSWDQMRVEGEARMQLLAGFKGALASLAAYYAVHEGPFLEGERATYADMIVGGWLNMFAATLPPEEMAELKAWHGGVFGRLHDALQERYFVCT